MDARVAVWAPVVARVMGCDLGVARETCVAVLRQQSEAGLVVWVRELPSMPGVWDIGDPEPEGVNAVVDDSDPDGDDSPRWGRTVRDGDWKGYKNGGKVYLSWAELVRRWGPVRLP
jgi:hypothetical protein